MILYVFTVESKNKVNFIDENKSLIDSHWLLASMRYVILSSSIMDYDLEKS